MTSRSRRKHPIIPASIIRSSGTVLCAAALLMAFDGTRQTSAAEPGGFLSNPIRKLMNRNPQQRADHMLQEQLQQEQNRRASLPPRVIPESVHSQAPMLPDGSAGNAISTVSGQGQAADLVEASYDSTTSDPRNLKKMTAIQPYADYQPELQVDTNIDPELLAPEEITLGSDPVRARQMQAVMFQWEATNYHHNPLYFEDPSLERYGHTYHPLVQPFASVARFGVQTVGLPYQMTIDPMWKQRYTLGWHRPGDCAPKIFPTIPWNTKAAVNQAGVVTGMFFLFP